MLNIICINDAIHAEHASAWAEPARFRNRLPNLEGCQHLGGLHEK
jgi:hypothetical protein